ncbi:MAG TPA: NADH-quinone oxidoreductase subunit L [Candidatus Sumerlaeota bacterium]|nr:NADH-quinone oxidoreductase subunit L [Candidatus Sumerlaeota bacterium]HOR26384.1 NADH-quinone oxidoreductase subunit L [Candidatus Sumerlaeota bacterium]HPK02602.1 NADH-quinone oxidoreductase subunit L [Candidatus Sumerlaeota bacterium]
MSDGVTLFLALGIFLSPLAGFILLAFLNRRLPRNGDWLATALIALPLLLAVALFARALRSPSPLLLNLTFTWLPMTTAAGLDGGLMVDRLTAVMLLVVTLVSFLVHLFSTGYMRGDARYGRYFTCLQLFTLSMLGLVLANNLLFLYIFWELVGLSSYLLIGHWFEKKSASNAAIKAFITTRLGDVGMFIGIMICYLEVGSLQYADLFAAVETGTLAGAWRTIAGLGIFIGAMGKSAQFPLHVWLPDAMEGPTPVSALIHAATMVAAGVYLTGRLLPLFDPQTLLGIAYIGAFTALFAASIALVQDDIKKVLAYSTVSQLGYMILALGVGGYVSGLFHLTTHALFKAGLFLGSGAVIHAMHHEQSMSRYGGLARKMPWTAVCYLLATLALVGFPMFSGFWSKDAILSDALAFSILSEGHWFLPAAGFATVFMTAFYMFRQYFLTFTGAPRDRHAYDHAHEVGWSMRAPLVILGILAVVGGGLTGKWFGAMNPSRSGVAQVAAFHEAGHRSPWVAAALAAVPDSHAAEHAADGAAAMHGDDHAAHVHHQAHRRAMILSTGLGLLGILLGMLMYYERRGGATVLQPAVFAARLRPLHTLLLNKYFIDELYHWLFVRTTVVAGWFSALFDRRAIDAVVNLVGRLGWLGGWLIEIVDRVAVDWFLVMGSARAVSFAGDRMSYAHTGRVRQYMVYSAVGLVVLGGFVVWWM